MTQDAARDVKFYMEGGLSHQWATSPVGVLRDSTVVRADNTPACF